MTVSSQDMENHTIIRPQKTKKNVFWGHSSCLRDIHILNHLYEIKSRGTNFGLKIEFRPSFSLITMSILKLDPLKIPKQLLLSWSSTYWTITPHTRLVYMFLFRMEIIEGISRRCSVKKMFCRQSSRPGFLSFFPLWLFFMDGVQLSQGCIAITFYHEVPRSSYYSFDQPRKDDRLILPWSHTGV